MSNYRPTQVGRRFTENIPDYEEQHTAHHRDSNAHPAHGKHSCRATLADRVINAGEEMYRPIIHRHGTSYRAPSSKAADHYNTLRGQYMSGNHKAGDAMTIARMAARIF